MTPEERIAEIEERLDYDRNNFDQAVADVRYLLEIAEAAREVVEEHGPPPTGRAGGALIRLRDALQGGDDE